MTEKTLKTNIPLSPTVIVNSGPLADLKRLPLIIQMVLLFMIFVFLWNQSLLGYNTTGIAWVVPFAFSLLILSRRFNHITFPFSLWLPWAMLLFSYLAMADSSLLDRRVIPQQRTLQLLSPLFVGMAVSTYRPICDDLRAFIATCRRMSYLILIVVGLKTGVLLTGILPSSTGLAAEAIAVTLLCTLFANSYLISRKKEDLILWALMTTIPFIAVTRTAIVASLLSFPLAFAPLRFSRRIVAVIIIALIGLVIFNSERVQKKMFFSGKGTIEDIDRKNEDFATSGRKFMWEKMSTATEDEYWTGHGTGSGETFIYNITGKTGYPHNDWLLTMYDYGAVGIIVYSICIVLTVGHALLRVRKRPDDYTRCLLLTGAAAYIPFIMLMFTDNIMIYSSYFGNLHFSILGLAYGALRARKEEEYNSRTVTGRHAR